jgi:class 3 adenylate cyclase
MREMPSGTVTFLFTDVEASTRLWQEQPDAARRAFARHDAVLHEAIASHHGRVFKTVGDAFCAAFWSAPDALRAAMDAQRSLQADTVGGHASLWVRMAIHSGQAEEHGGDYTGPTLARCARLLDVCHGGQVLLTLVAHELVRDGLPSGAALQDLAEHQLRDLARAERIYQLIAPGLRAGFPPLASMDASRHNLPVQLTTFVGREGQVADVARLLARHRLVTLTGVGGAGKTRLALQLAAESLDQFADGVWLVDLAPAVDEPAVVQRTA